MKTETQPNKAQQKIADQVRAYLKPRLGIDEEEVERDGTIYLMASDRRGAGDDEPDPEVIAGMRAHAKALRALSPYVFVGTEHVDEWVHLNVRVKTIKRQDKPEVNAQKLNDQLKAQLPDSILKHPKVRSVDINMPYGYDGRLTVETLIEGRYGRRSLDFGWRLTGDTTEGWRLLVAWGEHHITRAAKFKKLTAGIVLAQLEKLLARLADPLDALGWTINVKTPDGFRMTGDRRHRETFGLWQVIDKDRNTLRTNYKDATVVFTNNFSGKEISGAAGYAGFDLPPGQQAKIGEPVPAEVKPIEIVE